MLCDPVVRMIGRVAGGAVGRFVALNTYRRICSIEPMMFDQLPESFSTECSGQMAGIAVDCRAAAQSCNLVVGQPACRMTKGARGRIAGSSRFVVALRTHVLARRKRQRVGNIGMAGSARHP